MRSKLATLAGAAALAVVATAVQPAHPAYAQLSSCTGTDLAKGYKVKCTAGTGQVRAVAACYNYVTDVDYLRRGSWVNRGETSSAACGLNSLYDSGWPEFQG